MTESSFPCEPCPVEMKARCSQCAATIRSIIPRIPSALRDHPSNIPPGECVAVQDLWRKANEGDRLEADWARMRTDLRELWGEIFASWIFSDFDIRMSSCDSNEDASSLLKDLSEEARKIRRVFGFCAEMAKLSRLRIRSDQERVINLKDLIHHMSSSEVEYRFQNMVIDGALPSIRSDENRWIMILVEMLRGCFKEGSEIHVSSGPNILFFTSGPEGHIDEKRTRTSPRSLNLYRANRMLFWDGCGIDMIDDEDGIVVSIELSDKITMIDPIPPQIPTRCIGCVERTRALYDFYSSLMNDEESLSLPANCLVKPMLKASARLKKLLFKEWDTISQNIERAARDSCDPINSIIRMSSNIPDDSDPIGSGLLEDISHKVDEARSFMLMLKELNEIVFVEGDLFSEGAMFETTPIKRIIDDAVSILAGPIAQSGAEIVITTDLPSSVIRRKRWAKAFMEMIENSIIYNESERPSITIWSDDHRVFFRDNGIGIPKEKWRVVFDIFTSLNMGRHSTIRGEGASPGIGLFLTKRYIQLDGGDIKIISSNEGGTTIEILLPTYDATT